MVLIVAAPLRRRRPWPKHRAPRPTANALAPGPGPPPGQGAVDDRAARQQARALDIVSAQFREFRSPLRTPARMGWWSTRPARSGSPPATRATSVARARGRARSGSRSKRLGTSARLAHAGVHSGGDPRFTVQRSNLIGRLDPGTGTTRFDGGAHRGCAPRRHGDRPDGALGTSAVRQPNKIGRVDSATLALRSSPFRTAPDHAATSTCSDGTLDDSDYARGMLDATFPVGQGRGVGVAGRCRLQAVRYRQHGRWDRLASSESGMQPNTLVRLDPKTSGSAPCHPLRGRRDQEHGRHARGGSISRAAA